MNKFFNILLLVALVTNNVFANNNKKISSEQIDNIFTPKVKQFINNINKAYPFLSVKNTSGLTRHVVNNNIINEALNLTASANYQWKCTEPLAEYLDNDNQIAYYTMTCSGEWPQAHDNLYNKLNIKNLLVHAVVANRNSSQQWETTPLITADINNQNQCISPVNCRSRLFDYVQNYNRSHSRKIIAVINGGYFFMHKGFVDSNCIWKTALSYFYNFDKPLPTSFIGDGLTIINAQTFSFNCPALGSVRISPDRATWVVDNKGNGKIVDMPAGNTIDTSNIQQALGAGPMLIQNGEYAMEWQLIPSTFGYSANTGLALAEDESGQEKIVFFTVDGIDGKNGMYSFEMANFMKEYLGKALGFEIRSAMSMDHGGSTSMVTCSQVSGSCRLVSHSGEDDSGRAVYNGLAIIQ